MINPNTYGDDINALKKFKGVGFTGRQEDFKEFKKQLDQRIASQRNPLSRRLKASPPIRLEAAIHHYYVQLCWAMHGVIMASDLMNTRVGEVAQWHPDYFDNLNVSQTRLMSDSLKC